MEMDGSTSVEGCCYRDEGGSSRAVPLKLFMLSMRACERSLHVFRRREEFSSGLIASIHLRGSSVLTDAVVGQTSGNNGELSSNTHSHGTDVVQSMAVHGCVEAIS